MNNLIDVLKQKQGDLDNALHELANMHLALENVQRDIDVLRSALNLCLENKPETIAEETVRNRAYEFYEQRGFRDGFDREDWLRAEAEILGPFPPAPEQCLDMEPVSLN